MKGFTQGTELGYVSVLRNPGILLLQWDVPVELARRKLGGSQWLSVRLPPLPRR